MVKDVVEDADALQWKERLKEYIARNPTVEGLLLLSSEGFMTNPVT
jgi:hypothetical protein